MNLSQKQKELLTGLMLGDGCIQYSHIKGAGNPRLSIVRQLLDEGYNFWIYDQIKEFCNSPPFRYEVFDKRTFKTYYSSRMYSKSLPELKKWFKKWYPNGKKIVPKDLKLTPLTLLVWFLDDGTIINKGNGLLLKLATDGFSKEEIEFLIRILCLKFKSNFRIEKQKSKEKIHYRIVASSDATIKYIKYIEKKFPKAMERKMIWKNIDFETLDIRGSQIIKKNVFNFIISSYIILNNKNTITTGEIAKSFNWFRLDKKPNYNIGSYLKKMENQSIFDKQYETNNGRRAIFSLKDKDKLERIYQDSKSYIELYNIDINQWL